MGLLVEAMLQSSGFFYHWEKDLGAVQRDSSGQVQLGPYQLANRLSYFLYGSMPDAALFTAASGAQLATEAQIDAQARRMLADPKARSTVSDFISDLLDLDLIGNRPKDASVYGMFNETLQTAIRTETETFATNIVFGSGKFDDLMTSTTSSLNQPLAALYGVSGVSGANFTAATLNASQRGGLLTLAGFLASTGASNGSDPPRRGKVVFTRFLCTDLPPPPPVVPAVGDPQPGLSTRQRFEAHDQNAWVKSIPYFIIGGCGGFFKQGQVLSLPSAVPNNQLLTTVCHAMGLQVATVGSNYAGDIDSVVKA